MTAEPGCVTLELSESGTGLRSVSKCAAPECSGILDSKSYMGFAKWNDLLSMCAKLYSDDAAPSFVVGPPEVAAESRNIGLSNETMLPW